MSDFSQSRSHLTPGQLVAGFLGVLRGGAKAAKVAGSVISHFAVEAPVVGGTVEVLGRLGTPLAVLAGGAQAGIGIRRHNAGMVAGAPGMIAGSIGGAALGVAAIAGVGAVIGAPVIAPVAALAVIIFGVAGAWAGEKITRSMLTGWINRISGWKKNKASSLPAAAHSPIFVPVLKPTPVLAFHPAAKATVHRAAKLHPVRGMQKQNLDFGGAAGNLTVWLKQHCRHEPSRGPHGVHCILPVAAAVPG